MRPAEILTYAVFAALAGCASSSGSVADEWRTDRRARLEREHRVRSLDDALAEVIAQAPSPDSPSPAGGNQQDPERPKLDQRLPPRAGRGRRRHEREGDGQQADAPRGEGSVPHRPSISPP